MAILGEPKLRLLTIRVVGNAVMLGQPDKFESNEKYNFALFFLILSFLKAFYAGSGFAKTLHFLLLIKKVR